MRTASLYITLASATLVLASCGSEDSKPANGGREEAGHTGDTGEQTDVTRPAFDLVRISRGGTGVIAGRMTAGAKVKLLADGQVVSEVVADANGEWVIILEEPLQSGSVELALRSVDAQTGDVVESDDVVVASVPERDETRFVAREENGVVAVLSPKSGEGGSTILQKPGIAAFAEVGESLFVDTVDYGAGSSPVISGRSLPRVDVRVYLDDHFIGTSRASDKGNWSVTMTGQTVQPGQHTLRVDQTIREGKVQLRIEQPFETGVPIDTSQSTSGVMVQPGNTLWQIARQLYGRGVRYTLIFRENSEQIRDPDLIYPGQLFRLPQKDEKSE